MGEIRAARVDAGQAHFGGDAGQGRGVDTDLAHDLPTDVIDDGDGQEGRGAGHLGHGAFAGFVINFDNLGQTFHHRRHVARVFAHHDDPVGGNVVGKLYAVAVENLTAGGWDQADVDPVLFGEQAKLVGLIDLQIAHPRGQTAHEQQLRPAQKGSTPGQARVVCIVVGAATSHLIAPQSHPFAKRVQIARRGLAHAHDTMGHRHDQRISEHRQCQFREVQRHGGRGHQRKA